MNAYFINAISMDFPEEETDKFYIGAEDFNAYQCNLHTQNQNHIDLTMSSHNAPISKVHMHPGAS